MSETISLTCMGHLPWKLYWSKDKMSCVYLMNSASISSKNIIKWTKQVAPNLTWSLSITFVEYWHTYVVLWSNLGTSVMVDVILL